MLKFKNLVLPLIGSLALSCSALAQSDTTAEATKNIKNLYPSGAGIIIKYKSTNKSASMADSVSKADTLSNEMDMPLVFDRMMSGNTEVLKIDTSKKGFTQSKLEHLVEELNKRSDIEYAEIDELQIPYRTPNDPLFNTQWHYYEATGGMRLPAAWDITTGSTAVTVAVLDTGYRPHADLVANIVGEYDMISDTFASVDGDGRDANAQDPGDHHAAGECGEEPPRVKESSWHGTHVAGTVAANSNNNSGVAGVAWNVNLVPVRVLGKCGGSIADIADGIRWAAGLNVPGVPANPNPAQVINLSLGSSEPSVCGQTYQTAINDAVNAGVTIVVAAGNENSDAGFRPATCNNIIAVGATSRRGARAHYSNFGSLVDISAPGGENCEPISDEEPQSIDQCAGGVLDFSNRVISTLNAGETTPGADSFARYQGTSMAAPHIAGLAALMYSVNSDLTPAEVENVIKSTARSFPTVSNHQCTTAICGDGIADASAAVLAVSGTPGNNELENGVAETGLSAAAGNEVIYTLEVPAGAINLSFDMSGGTGDADLYVKFGSAPTTSSYDCRPYIDGNDENCTFASTQVGTYYVMVRAFEAYSNVSLVGNYSTDTNNELINDEEVEDLSATKGNMIEFTMSIPQGANDLSFEIYGGTGDADMHVKFGSPATLTNYDCRPYNSGNFEICDFNSPQVGTYYVMINAWRSFSGMTIVGSYTTDGGSQEVFFSSDENVDIPDDNSAGATSDIIVNRTGESGSVRITYNIVHTYSGDLTVKYIDSLGLTRTLRSRSGGSDDDINESKVVSLGVTPADGTWQLKVIDSAGGDTGIIDSWSMEFL